jgi:hypothetical protein
MGSSFQQQSLRRKIVYIVAILVLSTATYFLKQGAWFAIDAQAKALEIREEDRGEVELTGSALRLTLTGSRGLAVCGLWWMAQEKQKKHEWNELELIVNSLTKLQPHFITPWLFQSWNLAYNVSVESDRVRDKYFYMTRGIGLLGEGERQNKNHPDLRFSMGFYNQHKIGLSDEANYLRCLYQMSCIDPLKRSPERFKKEDDSGNSVIDMKEFEDFCRESPMLVRRLRDFLKRETPADVVDFLVDNQKIPSRYEEYFLTGPGGTKSSVLKSPEKQFPLLPPIESSGPAGKADPEAPAFDNYVCARDWFTYSLQPLPPPTPDLTANPTSYDRTKYRMPRYMASSIFRGYPSRGQSYVAEYLEKEGWFDQEGWRVKGWFPDDKFQSGGDAVVGDGQNWAVRVWSDAHDMWKTHGLLTGLYLEPEEIKNLQDRAQRYRERAGIKPGADVLEVPAELKNDDGFKAERKLYWYDYYRNLTNFAHFLNQSLVESDPKAVEVRKQLFAAQRLRDTGDWDLAREIYEKALPRWRDILLAHKEFRRDSNIQEDTCEIEMNYLDLVQRLYGKRLKDYMLLQDYLVQSAARPPLTVSWLRPEQLARDIQPVIVTPFAVVDEDRVPLIPEDVRALVRSRKGLPSLSASDRASAGTPEPARASATLEGAPPK